MIDTAVEKFKSNPSAKLIIIGFSPTGGGHTGRLLNIVMLALQKKSIPEHSIVLMHVPCLWEGAPRSPQITKLAEMLVDSKVTVLLAESDKSIYGYIDNNTGGSDDVSILEHMSRFPLRNMPTNLFGKWQSVSNITQLSECIFFTKGTDCSRLPIISAKNLLASISNLFGRKVIAERCYILTDMDPYLQKAAFRNGVPGKRALDQQNHAILLKLNDAELNLIPKYALLAKVLGGYGETISHIDLGGRNTLTSLVKITAELNIFSGTPKWLARVKVADLLISYRLTADQISSKLAETNRPFSGVIAGPLVNHGDDACNIIYVYAHKKTNIIARCVNKKMLTNDPAFQKIIFLFCGDKAVGNYNAMHLAYIADADGITTAGAGTVGEYAYLRKNANCSSRLLILPIESHNEQERNAQEVSEDNTIKSFIMNVIDGEKLSESLQRFVSGQSRTTEAPYSMSEFITATNDQNTYVQQAYELLFDEQSSINFDNIAQIERIMNKNPLLRATRKYLKLVFQSLDITDRNTSGTIDITLQQGVTKSFDNISALNKMLNSTIELARVIGLDKSEDAETMPLLKEVRAYFSALLTNKPISQSIKLKKEFGEFMITGF